MRSLVLALGAVAVLTGPVQGEMREFTDLQGRKLTAEVVETGAGWIKVMRKDGQRFTLSLDSLSPPDRAWLEARAKQIEADALAAKRALEVPAKIVAFCREQIGKQVGNGECWTLANECFKACDLKRPADELRVWGRKLRPPKERPAPGDIVEFRDARFADGATRGPEHTAIVIGRGRRRGSLLLAEQNVGGVKSVQAWEMSPENLKAGEILFYRPE